MINYDAIPTRKPIITSESIKDFPPSALDHQWNLITEALRQEMLVRGDVRKALIPFCQAPVSEKLPEKVLETLTPLDTRIAKLSSRFQKVFGRFTKLPEIPTEFIIPNVQSALPHASLQELITQILTTDDIQNRSQIQKAMQITSKRGDFTKGLTPEEKQMIIRRNGYARDVKLLALGAEILDQHPPLRPSVDLEIGLPSGTKIGINPDAIEQATILIQPHMWVRRKQFHARVYEIDTGGKRYILKEKKTRTHEGTKKDGFVEGQSSSEEFRIAKSFYEKASVEEGILKVCWEKPIGYVQFPDGYQFTIFESLGGLLEEETVQPELQHAILENREQFETEYSAIKQHLMKFLTDPYVVMLEKGSDSEAAKELLKGIGVKAKSTNFSFEDYALIKSVRLIKNAKQLIGSLPLRLNYDVDDLDGYAFRISRNGKMQLEIVGFDFEYFFRISENEAMKMLENQLKYYNENESIHGINSDFISQKFPITAIQQAAYFALIELEGKFSREQTTFHTRL